jgi:hypothetical protein
MVLDVLDVLDVLSALDVLDDEEASSMKVPGISILVF